MVSVEEPIGDYIDVVKVAQFFLVRLTLATVKSTEERVHRTFRRAQRTNSPHESVDLGICESESHHNQAPVSEKTRKCIRDLRWAEIKVVIILLRQDETRAFGKRSSAVNVPDNPLDCSGHLRQL
jgi:hypothetical protein